MEVHFLSDNDRKHSAWFTWELRTGAKRKKKKPIKIKCLLRAKITKTGFKTIVFLINQYWNSTNRPTHSTAVTVFLKMSKLKMTGKEIPDFIKISFRRQRERAVLMLMLSCTGIHASSKSRHKNTRVNTEQTSAVYAYLRKQVFRVSLSAKCYLFQLQTCAPVLCTLMGAPERAASSNGRAQVLMVFKPMQNCWYPTSGST